MAMALTESIQGDRRTVLSEPLGTVGPLGPLRLALSRMRVIGVGYYPKGTKKTKGTKNLTRGYLTPLGSGSKQTLTCMARFVALYSDR